MFSCQSHSDINAAHYNKQENRQVYKLMFRYKYTDKCATDCSLSVCRKKWRLKYIYTYVSNCDCDIYLLSYFKRKLSTGALNAYPNGVKCQ